jgi:hypothetical protein
MASLAWRPTKSITCPQLALPPVIRANRIQVELALPNLL